MKNIQMTVGSGPAAPETDKTFQTLRARTALCGCMLLRLEDGTFLLGKWELQTELPSIEAVEQFLSRMEGV